MREYLNALKQIMNNGNDRNDRTGVGTRSVFGHQMRFDLRESFPAVTTKKLAWKAVVSELLWILEGSSDERRLAEIHYGDSRENLVGKKTIWTANADKQGADLGYSNNDSVKELGPVYGSQWRSWEGMNSVTDQIRLVLNSLKNNPDSRRHIVSAWNVEEIENMSLPPCHVMFQFYVHNNELSCQLYQRSADFFLGVPFNIASYSLLTHMFAEILGMGVGEFIWTGGDCHIYTNHFDAVKEQVKRKPLQGPTLVMPTINSLNDVLNTKPSDYVLANYEPMPSIKASMAV
ncbi:thymidylate synthase [Methanohalobium sp.]|uniref:thymidylate synthase n=1 Tax=Methanohalobium sp. TaxID=2837493 RepID=UPI0025EE853D|nr:thymidylate synthase [Methanohalobium sp.]